MLAIWFYRAETHEPLSQRQRLELLLSAVEAYDIDNHQYPSNEQGLQALLSKPRLPPVPENFQTGGYLRSDELLTDLWGNPVQYRHPGAFNAAGFDLWSFGADGRPGGIGQGEDIIISR